MKKIISSFTIGALAVISTQAFPIYEPFDYDPADSVLETNLIGRVNPGGQHWEQAGPSAGATNQVHIEPGNIDYPGRPPAKGNRARFGGNGLSTRLSWRDIDVAFTETIYYSFLYQVFDSTTLNDTGVFWAGFNNTSNNPQETTPSVVSGRMLTKNDVTNNIEGNYLAGTAKTTGTAGQFTFVTNSLTTNEIVFVVVAFTFVGENADPDFARMWINPDVSTWGSDTPPPADIENFAGNEQGNIRSFVLFNRALTQPGDIMLDELLIGKTWADVTPRTNDMLAVPPVSQRVAAGNDVLFETKSWLADSIQWQHEGTNIPGATANTLILTNVQSADAGTYSVVYSNAAGISISNATLTVVSGTYPSLTPLWSLAPGDRPYITVGSSARPPQRSIAYNAASNEVYIITLTNSATGANTGEVHVLDATTGADLRELNADSSIITQGNDVLANIEVGEDGSIYAANWTDNAGGANGFKIYRWTNSLPDTPPVLVYGAAEPASSPRQHRWGETFTVRGAGAGTEIMVDDNTGIYGALITPLDDSLNFFISAGFYQSKARPSSSRSLQFGPTNSIWQYVREVQYTERGALQKWTYDAFFGTSTLETNLDVFSTDVGPMAIDFSQNLAAALSFSPIAGVPDKLALYDISNIANPVLIARYDFPVVHQSNSSAYGKVVISGDRVYAINGNNGVVAFQITAFKPSLTITPSGSNVILSWSTNATGYTLQHTDSLDTPITWNDIGTGTIVGDKYFVTNSASADEEYFRLIK